MLIAVFARNRQRYSNFRMSPKEMFVTVHSADDIMGRKFDGIITYIDWYHDEKVRDAYEILKHRQPELWPQQKKEE